MTEDIIEKVARAIHTAMEYDERYDWDKLSKDNPDRLAAIAAARAAIEAMREESNERQN